MKHTLWLDRRAAGRQLGAAIALIALVTILSGTVTTGHAAPPQVLNAPSMPVPKSYFGMHIHRADSGTPWPAVPFGSWRLWDAYAAWPSIQPKRGTWDFQRLDRYLAMADKAGVDVILPLALTPSWASARPSERSSYGPGNAAEAADMEDWRVYVRTVAQRYKGRIRYYEIWNEPNTRDFYTGSIETLVALTREASRVLKSIDPDAKLIGPSGTGGGKHLDWLDSYLSGGAKSYLDIVSYHFYVAESAPEAMIPLIQQVRQVMVRNGMPDKPLWNTESGWWIENTDGTPPGGVASSWKKLGSQEAAAYIARALILGWASGLGRYYWYAWDNKGLGLIEPGNKDMKPAGRAFGVTYKWLVGNTLRSCEPTGSTWTCEIAGSNGDTAWLVWSSGGSSTWTLPSGWLADSVEDLDGKAGKPADASRIPITESPVRVLGRKK